MIRHLFKLIWNRKRANALVIAEIFVCFLVLFAVVTLTLYSVLNYQRPLGFTHANVLGIDVDYDESHGDGQSSTVGVAEAPVADNPYETRQRALLDLVKADPAVENAAWASPIPFSQSNESRGHKINGRDVRYSLAYCTDEYKDVLRIEMTRGRWFSAEDDGGGYDPVVVSEALAQATFGDADPLGRTLNPDRTEDGDKDQKDRRIVGVMRAFRQEGEMATTHEYALFRAMYPSVRMRRVGNMAIRVRPGSDATVEARLAKTLQSAAPDWSFRIEPLDTAAEFTRNIFMTPIILAAIVASFLILMVALGLSGVLWQSVTTRIREIGVRRALGASAGAVRAQIIGELLTMTTIATVGGVLVVLQFPFLNLLGAVPKSVFLGSLSLTIVALYALAIACGLQPARLATTVHPAEALRYE